MAAPSLAVLSVPQGGFTYRPSDAHRMKMLVANGKLCLLVDAPASKAKFESAEPVPVKVLAMRKPKNAPLAPPLSLKEIKVKAPVNFEWQRTYVLALALSTCSACRGSGLRVSNRGVNPCTCVTRAIFRHCFSKWKNLITQERSLSQVGLAAMKEKQDARGCEGRLQRKSFTWGRKAEEFIADFELVSKRTLTDATERRIFELHFLRGLDWKVCTRLTGIDRGNFFHAVYRIEQRLGRVFRELKPYALYPLDEYFGDGRIDIGAAVRPAPVRHTNY